MSNLSEKQKQNKIAYIQVKRLLIRGSDRDTWLSIESSVFMVGIEQTIKAFELDSILNNEQIAIARMALHYIQHLQNQSAKYS